MRRDGFAALMNEHVPLDVEEEHAGCRGEKILLSQVNNHVVEVDTVSLIDSDRRTFSEDAFIIRAVNEHNTAINIPSLV